MRRRSPAVVAPWLPGSRLVGILYGIPMSFDQIFISAIGGTGLAVAGAGVSRRKFLFTALAWIGSLVFSLVIGYDVYAGASALFGIG